MSSLRQRIAAFIESDAVTYSVIALIVVNAVVLGLEAIHVSAETLQVLHWVDHALLAIFVIELLLKLVAYRWRFFTDAWNVFDFVVIAIALIPAGEAFGVLRALRIMRALRLVSLVPSMRKVVTALLAALPGMSSIVALLLLVIYVAAVMATKLFHDAAPEFFGSLGESLFTLFQIMTVEGWPDIARQVIEVKPWAWIFFVLYLVCVTFTVLNLFIAVIVNSMQEQVAQEAKQIEDLDQRDTARDREILTELRALRAEVEKLHLRKQ